MRSADAGDPIWEDLRTDSERWRDDWVERDRAAPIPHRGFVLRSAAVPRSRAEIRSLLRRQLWSAPRRGVVSIVHPRGDPRVAAALEATATALARPMSVISHESAAILHGLPVLQIPEAPLVTAPARNGNRAGVGIHLTSLAPAFRADWFGASVTTVARAVVDIARRSGPIAGLITGDAALRDELCNLDELAAAVLDATGRPGNAAARWVVERADPRSESPLESLTRARLLLAGLPAPELQVEIPQAGARVDLLYRPARLIIEADGLLKYTQPSVLRAEKLRQERLELAGYHVVRVLWSDVIGDATTTLVRINRILARRS